MNHFRLSFILTALTAVAVVLGCRLFAADANPPSAAPVDFARDIQPIFQARCYDCHGSKKQKGGMRLDSADALKGGDSNEKLLIPGEPDRSHILKLVRAEDDEKMPPKGERLSAGQIELLTRWVREGGKWAEHPSAVAVEKQKHWSFNPPVRPTVPTIAGGRTPNPIDAFILSRLVKEGLTPSPQAEKAALIRRASFDLIGLPPTPAEVDAFVKDASPDAYEKLVDRLMASPHFGERWARMWLDLARYADSKGYGSDPLRMTIHRYRDWVIDAFNQNKPFDQFTIEQLAGDLLPHPTQEQLIATAFHRNTMTNTEGGTDDEEFRVAAVKDRNDVTSQVWMGLTMGCAQCHTHKFDPITNREYYQMLAFFNQTEDADRADESPTIPTPGKDQLEQKQKLEADIVALDAKIRSSPAIAAAQQKWEATLPDAEAGWSPLTVTDLKSLKGTTLTRQADGSILATGDRPATDTYTLSATSDLKKITAFRLEALPDDSLPEKGPGRSGNGNFILNEFRVSLKPTQTTEQPGLSGRFVRIELPGKKKYLALAEVQAFQGAENVALHGKAKQSSTGFDGPAQLAIDGNTSGEYARDKSVAHSAAEDNPWWEVDLGGEKSLDRISIWNRTDGVGDRLANFRVSVLNSSRQSVWTKMIGPAPAPSISLALADSHEVPLARATATYEQPDNGGWTAAKAIDGDAGGNSGWAVGGKPGERHVAIFETAADLTPGTTPILFTFVQNFETGTLGRFRVSATTRKRPVHVLPSGVTTALATLADKRTEAQQGTIRDYFLATSTEVREEFAKVAPLRKQLSGMKFSSTAIMRELPADKRRTSTILVKGNFLVKGDPVEPKVLASFHPMPAGAPANRLGLAQWIVDKQNPLTARVAVNRFWAQFFGTGLVETQEDFGEQGQPPSHPELLDWLACEFMSPTVGGSNAAWDMKRLLRLMVTSATYRQSAKIQPETLAKDARNRLLAHAPRQRLEAEMVRDQALRDSGLLSEKMFGPSVYPPQPDGMWQAAFNGERTYPTSTGEDRYRRGLYTFWRRTVPYPSMQTFDAPSREVCTIRRIHTCTPLQAFVTMNDPVYVECSQALGRRMVKEGGAAVADRIRFGLQLVLQRPASDSQVQPLMKLYEQELAHFGTHAEDAKKLAGMVPEGADVAESAAWTMVANVLLNLDGAMTR